MEKKKLYGLLRSFTKDEMNEFSKFLNSPYFNESRNTVKLFSILRKHYPDFNSKSIEPGRLYMKVFSGNEEVHLNSLNNLFSRLKKLAVEYMSISRFRNHKNQSDFSYIGELKQRGLDKLFERKSKAVFENKGSENESDLFLYKYLIGYMESDYLLKDIYGGKNSEPFGVIFSNLYELQKFFYLNLFRGYSRLLMFGSLFNLTFSVTSETAKIRTLIEQIPSGINLPVLRFYREFFRVFESVTMVNSDTEITALRSVLFENEEHIEREDFVFMLKMLFQFGAKAYDSGNKECGKQVLEMLKITNHRKLWHNYNGKLSEYAFSNSILFALKMGEFDWVSKFIFDNADFIDSDNSKEIVNYNLACFHFYRARAKSLDTANDFELALDHISKVNTHFYLKKITIFDILIITYYELDEIDMMFYQCDSYNHYMKACRNLVPPAELEKIRNFNKFAHTLGKLKSDFKEKEFEKLVWEIEPVHNCTHKDWLFSKIKLLRKKQKV